MKSPNPYPVSLKGARAGLAPNIEGWTAACPDFSSGLQIVPNTYRLKRYKGIKSQTYKSLFRFAKKIPL